MTVVIRNLESGSYGIPFKASDEEIKETLKRLRRNGIAVELYKLTKIKEKK